MTNVTPHPSAAVRHPLCDSDDLAFDLALGYFGEPDLCLKHAIDLETLNQIRADEGFQRLVLEAAHHVDERGDAFRLKARRHMDDMIESVREIADDEKSGRGVRLQAISMLSKYAGYEEGEKAGTGVTLQIRTNLDMGNAKAKSGGAYTLTADMSADDGSDLL